ncbi:hypothetical protein RUM43_011917 [Polyplax serrata]|uniref:Uncharacterized protein n=1 Tax=Polyplax serrata TaxID=468196 RepID=A0AAN8S7G7_POLSC
MIPAKQSTEEIDRCGREPVRLIGEDPCHELVTCLPFSWTVDKTIAGVLKCVLSKMAEMQLDLCVQNNYDNVMNTLEKYHPLSYT